MVKGFDSVIDSLTVVERKILLKLNKTFKDFLDVVSSTGLSEIEVRRGISWLKSKHLVKVSETLEQFVVLDRNGEVYASTQLPENKLVQSISKLGIKTFSKEDLFKFKLSEQEINICLGILKKENFIEVSSKNVFKLKSSDPSVFLDRENFLKSLPKKKSELNKVEKVFLDYFSKRKNIVKLKENNLVKVCLSSDGFKIIPKLSESSNLIEVLTPKMIEEGSWEGKTFRKYDFSSPSPRVNFGKKHPYSVFLEEVKQKFVSLGFEECSGPVVESDFWNMDALFMPQFHSARDIHDAYYVKKPKLASDVPVKFLKSVKKFHESGGNISKGWRYKFDEERSKRNVLRTHDTSISSRTLASKDLKVPGKYFQLVRCFRYDVIDATHLADFNQVGGFILEGKGKELSFRHLFGVLETFAKEFCGTDEIKIVPAYFPFTEPSASLYAKHPSMGWIELAGSGIFRPEMTNALGVDVPVIAWGIGIDRLAMFKLGLQDIRDLFSHDLNFLREAKI